MRREIVVVWRNVVRSVDSSVADEIVGGDWFRGYADRVDLYEDAVMIDQFHAGARADAARSGEFAVFRGGLVVSGEMSLDDNGWHSIYVVQGGLRARRVILGDAVLVVQGAVEVADWLLGLPNEGVFEVGGEQIESSGDADAMLRHVRGPLVALFDRGRDRFVLRERGERRGREDLLPELLDDDKRHGVNEELLRKRITRGEPLFTAAGSAWECG